MDFTSRVDKCFLYLRPDKEKTEAVLVLSLHKQELSTEDILKRFDKVMKDLDIGFEDVFPRFDSVIFLRDEIDRGKKKFTEILLHCEKRNKEYTEYKLRCEFEEEQRKKQLYRNDIEIQLRKRQILLMKLEEEQLRVDSQGSGSAEI